MYRCTTDVGEVREYLSGATVIAFDFETSPDDAWRDDPKAALDPHKSHIVGVSFSIQENDGLYLPLAHAAPYANADFREGIKMLADLCANRYVIKVAHNLAFESAFLYALGIVVQAPVYDTMLAAMMTLKSNYSFRTLSDSGLKKLVPELFEVSMPSFEDVTRGLAFDQLDSADPETIRYACADADYALRLYHTFNRWFMQYMPKHRYIVETIESPTAVYLGIMRYNGVLMNVDQMAKCSKLCVKLSNQLRNEIALLIGAVDIGSNASTNMFKEYLFATNKLPILKTTEKAKEALDDETLILLDEWCAAHLPELRPLFKLVLELRRVEKLDSTYIKGYLKYVDSQTGCIYPHFYQLGAESGRFSCQKPNVQNNANDKDINTRDFFIAPEGYSLIEADYSQIEARLAAVLSRDERLLNVFEEGKDLHAMTTAAVFQIPLTEAADKAHPEYKHRRTVAKATFFGFMYGMYGKTLQRNLKTTAGITVSLDDANRFLANLKASYPTLTRWQQTTIEKARAKGYAETLLGRRRYVPDIRSENYIKSGNAERSALNHGVQGYAADLLKLAMARLVERLTPTMRPLFTVHDSLVFEVPDDQVHEAAALIKVAMEIPPPVEGFGMRIIAEVSVGKSYGNMKELA